MPIERVAPITVGKSDAGSSKSRNCTGAWRVSQWSGVAAIITEGTPRAIAAQCSPNARLLPITASTRSARSIWLTS